MRPSLKNGIAFWYVMVWLITGCDVQDTTPKQTKLMPICEEVKGSGEQLRHALREDLASSQYECFETHIDAARSWPLDDDVAKLARAATTRNDLPDRAMVFALSYLLLADGADPKAQTQAHLNAIRSVARTGRGKAKTTAIALLSARRADEDLSILQEGIGSGDDAVLAYSIFGMANSCSEKARDALREALSSPPVKAYLTKHADKESITATVKRDCPGALA